MKTILKTFFFALIIQSIVTDSYAVSYRVIGQVYYGTGQNKWTRSITSKVVSEIPVIIQQGEQIVSLVFIVEPPPSNKYSVMVTLSTNPKSTDGFSTTVLAQTFHSTLVGGENGPLEFEMEQKGIKVGGALGVSVVR